MRIRKTKEMETHISRLWETFLLAGVAKAIMLGEVEDHMYVTPPEKPLGRQDAIEYMAMSGFSEDIRNAAEQIYEEPESVGIYGELAGCMQPENLMDHVMDAIISHTTLYDGEMVRQNPYYQAVHPHVSRSGALQLAMRDTLPYECIQSYHSQHDRQDPFFMSDIGFFQEKVTFPALLEKKQVWMSIVMSEIESMQPDIESAHGNVITYGLGLGYYAFMVAQKPEVQKVTVVELSPDVIYLFKKNILPQFPYPEEIEIIQGDAYEFLKQQTDGAYDFGYADFWAGILDGPELYLRFLPETRRFRQTKFGYWIESCFIDAYFRPAAMAVLMEKVLGRSVALMENKKSLRRLQQEFKGFLEKSDLLLETPDDVDALLTPERMTALVRAWGMARR